MVKNYLIHKSEGNVLLSSDEIINNAREQEQAGTRPHYIFYDYTHKKKITPPGWLVWSTSEDGAGVVYKREDNKYIIVTGWQGEFIYQ